MESLTILILYSHPWKFGGGETYVLSLMQQLVKGGHHVILVTDDSVKFDLPFPGVMHYPLTFRSKNPLDFIRTYIKLKRIAQKHDIDIIHAQQRTAGYFAAAIKKQLNIPFVITLHDIWHRAPFKNMHGKIFKNVIAVSEYMRRQFIETFSANPDHVVTIYNGVDEKKYHDETSLRVRGADFRQQFSILPEENVVAIIGRVTKAKGHFDLIAAVDNIRNLTSSFRVLIIGDGPDVKGLKQFIHEKKLEDKIIFTGFQSDIPGIMMAADIVVLPSYREAFGLSIVEATLAKKPVIASAVGGIVEIIDDKVNGLLIEPRNIDQLSEGLKQLLTDRGLRQKLGQAGYHTAIEKFTLAKMTSNTELYYKQVIGK